MATRNANGEGTVYRRKDGRYEATAYLPTTSGKSKRVSFYGKTRAEVHGKLVDAKAQVQRGLARPDRIWKLSDYLDYWLKNVVTPNLRPTTTTRYSVNVRLYLKPALGGCAITQLTVPIVQEFLNEHLAKGHSVRSAQIVKTVLSSALTHAQREELVIRNVARLAKLPTYERGDVIPWTDDEARAFVSAIRSHQHSAAFLLLTLYGLRRGEILGLRWQDIDSVRSVIRVRQQVIPFSGGPQIMPLKTKASRRDLPLLDLTRQVLAEQQERQAARGETATGNNLIFTTSSGRPVDPNNFSRTFRGLYKKHGLRRIKLHDLRHTTATILKDLGVPARNAQLILGHSSLSTTQEIYQHDNLEGRYAALRKIEQVLHGADDRGALPSKLPSKSETVEKIMSSTSGTRGGYRTHDLRLMRPIEHTLENRLTSIKRVAQCRTRTWLLGCVAVNLAVKLIDTNSADSCAACGRASV